MFGPQRPRSNHSKTLLAHDHPSYISINQANGPINTSLLCLALIPNEEKHQKSRITQWKQKLPDMFFTIVSSNYTEVTKLLIWT